MRSLSAAVVQLNSGIDLSANLETAEALIAAAAEDGAQLILLPECFALIGSREGSRALAEAEASEQGPVRQALADWARRYAVWLVAGSLPVRQGDRSRARCLVYDNGGHECVHYDKIHLFDVDLDDATGSYRESDEYAPGDVAVLIETPWGKLGLSICYDLRFPELYRELARRGAEIICVPAAFTRLTGAAHWDTLLRARAIENQCFILAANQTGSHPGPRQTWGHSQIIDPWGERLIDCGEAVGYGLAQLDAARLDKVRRDIPCGAHRRL